METIKAYVENVFRTLPDSDEILRTKEEILNNMLEKYNELKAEGKSEHEAVGIVISEFGNIDELLEEMNLLPKKAQNPELIHTERASAPESNLRFMPMKEVQDYISSYKKAAKRIALGVLLCLVGVCLLIFFEQLSIDNIFRTGLVIDGDEVFGLIPFFLFIAVAVGLFISTGMSLSKYQNVYEGIQLEKETLDFLEATKTELRPAFTRNLIIGVLMCVISPVILIASYAFVSDDCSYPVVIFLLIIACAVYIIVSSGIKFGSLTSLITFHEMTPTERHSNSLVGTLCGSIMLLATALYLYFGFVENNWDYAPAIYAPAGVLCGAVAVIVNGITEAKKK